MASIAITEKRIRQYALALADEEKASSTIEKYVRDIRAFGAHLGGRPITKQAAVEWKALLRESHAAASVNSMLAAVNGFCAHFGAGVEVKPYRLQRETFLPERKCLTAEEYERLLEAARSAGDERLFYIMETLCATGIRVGELEHITVAAARAGAAAITSKGKTRTVFLPESLRRALLGYAGRRGISSGRIFVTRSGRAVSRSSIWSGMKRLCESAGVDAAKAFPHNLRGLFSRTFYSASQDMAKLADMLGHSSMDTTRIYVRESEAKHRHIVEKLELSRMKYI